MIINFKYKELGFGVTWPYPAPDTYTPWPLVLCWGKAPCNNEQWDIVKNGKIMATELQQEKNKVHILESIPQGAMGILHTSRALKPRTNCTQLREHYRRELLLICG